MMAEGAKSRGTLLWVMFHSSCLTHPYLETEPRNESATSTLSVTVQPLMFGFDAGRACQTTIV